jgi:hypothetical protein
MTALYLGGFPLHMDGGGAGRQLAGLLVTFALYLVLWFAFRALLRGPLGTAGGIAVACLIATLLLPLLARVAFRILGVRITTAAQP